MGPRPAARAHAAKIATPVGIAVAVFAFAYDRGGYALESRDLAAVLVWSGVLCALLAGVWRGRGLPPRAAMVAGVALTALAALAAASAAWSPSVERALDDAGRTLLYAGVFFLVALPLSPAARERCVDGLAIAITAVVAVALVSRFFPSVFGSRAVLRTSAGAVWRLSFPIGYWNGLAIFAALGIPLLLRAALAHRHPLLRGLALTPLPAFAALIYLASSRGGTLAAVVGILTFLALVGRRTAAVAAIAVAACGAVVTVAVVRDRPEIVNGPFTTAIARDEGRAAAFLVAAACIGCGLVYAGLAAAFRRARVGARVETAVLVAGAVATIVAVVAAHPVRRFDHFRQLPGNRAAETAESHLLSSSGTGRWQLWQAAVDEFRTRPVLGRGAGSYQMWQTRHGSLGEFVQDAHSAYLQNLAELGLVGLVLLLSALGAGFVAGAAGLRSAEGEARLATSALLAALAAFSVALAFDWMWQLPAVAVVGVIVLALLTGATDASATTAARPSRRTPADPRPWAVALGVLAAAAVIFAGLPLLSQLEVKASRRNAATGNLEEAVRHGRRARSLTPWNATPYVQVALVAEQGGDFPAARAWAEEATRHDPSDWRLWLTAARIQAESGHVAAARRSLARARTLHPRLPLVASPR